jgi:hypothetical protein
MFDKLGIVQQAKIGGAKFGASKSSAIRGNQKNNAARAATFHAEPGGRWRVIASDAQSREHAARN